MEVPLTPDLESRLARIAEEQGRSAETLALEAVERFVNYDEWFLKQIEEGIAEADRGEFVEDAEVRELIDRKFRN